METKFPPLAAPSSLSRAVGAEPRGRPSPTPRPSATGVSQGRGTRRGGVCGAEGSPAPWSLQDLPTPTPHPLEASLCPPAPPHGGKATRRSLSPRTLQTSAFRQRSPAAAGERGRTALVRQVNTRAGGPPTLPRLPPPGRDTPLPLSRLPRDADAARGARALWGSGSRLTGSGELASARAPAWARRPPGLPARTPRGSSRRRRLGKVGERHRLSRAPAPSPSESERDRGSEL